MVDGMMSSAFAAAAAAHQDSLSRMTSMTNSIAPPQGHASHTASQILGIFSKEHPSSKSDSSSKISNNTKWPLMQLKGIFVNYVPKHIGVVTL